MSSRKKAPQAAFFLRWASPSMMPMISDSFMIRSSSPSIFTSVPDHLPNRMRSPAFTSSSCSLPFSSRAPGPTATISPSIGFSFAVSGMMMPPAVLSSAVSRRTRTRSCRGRNFMFAPGDDVGCGWPCRRSPPDLFMSIPAALALPPRECQRSRDHAERCQPGWQRSQVSSAKPLIWHAFWLLSNGAFMPRYTDGAPKRVRAGRGSKWGPGGGLRRAGFPPRRNGDDNEPGLADEGLPPDHRRDSLSAARPPEAPANLHLAGPRPRPALPGAAEVPGFLGNLAGRQAALGARRFGDPDQAGRVPPRLSHAAALAGALSSAAPGSGGARSCHRSSRFPQVARHRQVACRLGDKSGQCHNCEQRRCEQQRAEDNLNPLCGGLHADSPLMFFSLEDPCPLPRSRRCSKGVPSRG